MAADTMTQSIVTALGDAKGFIQTAIGKAAEINGQFSSNVAAPPVMPTSGEYAKNLKSDMSNEISALKLGSDAMVVVNKRITDALGSGVLPAGSPINAALQTQMVGVTTDINNEITYLTAQAAALTATNISNATLQSNLLGSTTDLVNQQTLLQNQANAIAFSLPHSPNSAYYSSPLGQSFMTPQPAPQTGAKAMSTFQGVTFTAVTVGVAGNSIALTFDGTDTVATVCTAWNTANTTNQVVYTGLGTVILTAGSTTLFGGYNNLATPPAWSAPAVVT